MAKQVLKKAMVKINSVDVSDHVSKIEVDDQFEEKDVTTYGSNGAKEVLAGLESGTCPIGFKNDYAAGQLDATMWALRGTLTTVDTWPDKTAVVSSANPRYSATIAILNWKPIAGSVGDVAEVDVSFPVSGGWNRYTTT
jgi:hypothetical protein